MAAKGQTIADAMRALSSHASLEDLFACREGRLAGEEAARIEAHVSGCRSCAEWSADLEQFLTPPEAGPEGEAPPVDTAEIWRNLFADNARGRQPGEAAAEATPPVARGGHERRYLEPLAVALLMATVLSSAAWYFTQRRVARLEGIEFNVPVVEIDSSVLRRPEPGEAPGAQEVPPGAVLIFTPRLEPKKMSHEVRIFTADGRLVWSGSGLRPTPRGSFQLRLPRNLRPGETYTLGIVPGDRRELTIRITKPAPD